MKQFAGCLVGTVAIVASGCTSASSAVATGGRHAITGTIVAARDASTVTLAHDAIDGYMPAMTMDFRADALPPVRAGDRVRATLVVAGDSSRLDGLVVLAAGGGAASAAAVLTGPTAPGGIVPDAMLRNQFDRPIRLHDFRGRVLVITFIYARCPLPEFCPRLMQNFRELRRTLAARPDVQTKVHLLAVSIDPVFDTPTVLRDYGRARLGANGTFDRLDLATGDPAEIARLAGALGLWYEPASGLVNHSMVTAIIGADGRLVKHYPELTWDLRSAMPVLEREAARVLIN